MDAQRRQRAARLVERPRHNVGVADCKFTTSFGCPTFLNFGKNYAGARDDFVYVYSHDSDSAYTAADRMVLGRVGKMQILP